MDELRWSDALQVGVPSIDAGHHGLAALIDAIERAVSRGEDASDVQELLARLVEDTREHFDVEQNLMRTTGFPGRDAHEREHERLLGHVSMLLNNRASGQSRMTVDDARALRDWLMHHVAEADQALGRYLLSTGARSGISRMDDQRQRPRTKTGPSVDERLHTVREPHHQAESDEQEERPGPTRE